jgi:hypothetical protein
MACPPQKGKGSRWAPSRSTASSRYEGFMPFQCTKRPTGVEVIIRSLAPIPPKAPRRAVASGPLSWRKKYKSFSNAERDSEMPVSWRSVAKLREPSYDRLREFLDWNKSNPRKVAAVPEEVMPEADSTSIFAADAWFERLSRSSTNLSRSLLEPTTEVFGFMSTRNRLKLPAPSAMQTHEPKTNVMP